MADPICRWRNSSIKQVLEFNLLFPFTQMNKEEAREVIENRWSLLGGSNFFSTAYQLAAQLGIYYEDETTLYPRFCSLQNIENAKEYMLFWGKRYYAPNPYTRSMDYAQSPVIINNFLVNWAIDHEHAYWSEALSAMFTDDIGNTDILVNVINNFTEVYIKDDIISLKDPKKQKYNAVTLNIDPKDKKAFFDFIGLHVEPKRETIGKNVPSILQQIYFGAPGTGKSYEINRLTKGHAVVRTTFHPDSDYSTFVGAYKPIMEEVETRVVPVVINGGITMDQNNGTYKEKRITYKFVKQAFLKAYLGAWRKYGESRTANIPTEADPQFLVIEEINRGNCAQIFGDIFQLLDREDNGFSSYPIEADVDLQQAIAEAFENEEDYMLPANLNIDNAIEDYTSNYDATLTDDIINGRILLLPPNMYIWATMNTSDQSLFPIDSAFKRRWEQKYVPIDTKKESWVIKTKDNKYSWTTFLDNINAQIYDATHSEDKQLGFYFCKAKDNEIKADKFVSKVLFYIYNDVFKDYGFDREMFKDDENKPITFQSYFETDGSVKDYVIETFLKKLGVKPISEADSNAETTKQQAEE